MSLSIFSLHCCNKLATDGCFLILQAILADFYIIIIKFNIAVGVETK